MKKLTIVLFCTDKPPGRHLVEDFVSQPDVEKLLIVAADILDTVPANCEAVAPDADGSTDLLNIVARAETPYLLFVQGVQEIRLGPRSLERFVEVAETTGAGMVYADYQEIIGGETRNHPVNDYQLGSIREDFAFGPVTVVSRAAILESCAKLGPLPASLDHALYDLRLKVSVAYPLFRIREFLYTVSNREGTTGEDGHFAYLDPRNRTEQAAWEAIATAHLRRIGAFLRPVFQEVPPPRLAFPVEASVVIPVRNRVRTVRDAVQSALAQETDFPFNVLVVDNHSMDGTTALLAEMAQKHGALRHLVPIRHDLNIGGCWNEAVFSPHCGRYAVQLDSDDLYSSPRTLQTIVDLLSAGPYAMVIGSYALVNGALEPIPPGLIDHREWTEENGRNNALRIQGLGAPRAFNTEVLRETGFPNVGYGEDYAVALGISRQYRIGRIYENLYLCRRWEGNSDAALDIGRKNRYDAFKDQIRTLEILARQKLNGQGGMTSCN